MPATPTIKDAVVYHAPHTSTHVPSEHRRVLQLDDATLQHELNRLTDHRIDELLVPPSNRQHTLTSPVSRIVIDMERFPDDAMEPASKVGMGVIYTKTTTGAPLRDPPTPTERGDLMDAYYWPHHERLHTLTAQAQERAGTALILDLHSFPSVPLPTETSGGGVRPDICIGTDGFHTPPPLIESLRDAFSQAGLRVAVDDPFSGTIVPTNAYRSDPRVASVMIEVNRRVYLDETETRGAHEFNRIGAHLRDCLAEALQAFNRRSDANGLAFCWPSNDLGGAF